MPSLPILSPLGAEAEKHLKVVYVDKDLIRFEDRTELYSDHDQDCCESHYLSFADLSLSDFEGLVFDISSDSFFERVPDYGIRLIPKNGHSISVPGHGYNNGYYSSELTLVLTNEETNQNRFFDISECQEIYD